jgi:hypothetical protein
MHGHFVSLKKAAFYQCKRFGEHGFYWNFFLLFKKFVNRNFACAIKQKKGSACQYNQCLERLLKSGSYVGYDEGCYKIYDHCYCCRPCESTQYKQNATNELRIYRNLSSNKRSRYISLVKKVAELDHASPAEHIILRALNEPPPDNKPEENCTVFLYGRQGMI